MATLPRLQLSETYSASAFFADAPRLMPLAPAAAPAAASAATSADRDALLGQYGELAPRVQRFLRDLLGCSATAADATQETFVRAFRKVDALPPETRLAPWVFGIARNVSLEIRKARGRAGRVITGASPEDAERIADPRAASPETQLLDRESLEVIDRALDRLPEERRAALLLRLDHGLAYEEIAASMGWSLAKAKVEIFRAREVLRATLHEYRGGTS